MRYRFRHFTSLASVAVFFQVFLLWLFLPILLYFPLEQILRWLTPKTITPGGVISFQQILAFSGYWFSRKPLTAWNSCLKKSLVLYYFLNRYGILARFYLGVKKDAEKLTGHSWIESVQGCIGKPQERQAFLIVYAYPEQLDIVQ